LDLDAVRAALPALARGAYMNTGTAGPLPLAAATALRAAFELEVEQGRIGPLPSPFAAAREAVARLLQTTADRIALLHHSSDGLNAAALGLRFRPGDAVVTTDVEHAALQLPLGALRQRQGIEVRVARLGLHGHDPAQAAAAMERALRPGPVRAVFLSHVSYATGGVLAVRAMADAAHAAGAAVVVDGAQGAGALPVQPEMLGADLYTVSGQKWLCGPEGTGALWVAPGWEERLQPGAVGYMGIRDLDGEGHYLPAAGARRLEVGMAFRPGLAGWVAALQWLEGLGWAEIFARTRALAARARGALAALPGVEVLTPAEAGGPAQVHAGLVSFRVPGPPPEQAAALLRERGYFLRTVPGWDALRASCGFFLLDSEIDGLAAAVGALPRAGA